MARFWLQMRKNDIFAFIFMRNLYLVILLALLVSSCKIFRSNLMLKTPKDFNYDKLVDSVSRVDYKIAPNDAIVYRIFTNNGFKLIDLASGTNSVFRNDLDVIVESSGYVKMPLLERVYVAGLSVKEAEKLLEEKYSKYYVDPYVSLRVTNKRVIVFPGNGGQARVLSLANNNTTVMEVIANAGGIVEDGKAYKVKLIRSTGDAGKAPYVYLMDLSRIEGIVVANSIVQSGDIIYVEPRYRPLSTFNREVAPIISLITSFIIIYQFSKLR